MSYEIGDIARLRVSFTDIAGTLTDPSTVSVTIQLPDNSQEVFSLLPPIVQTSTGLYYYDLTITQSGIYYYRWAGTGAVMAVAEGSLTVTATSLVSRPTSGISSPGYSYDIDSDPAIGFVRLLIPDTEFLPNVTPPRMIFSDSEINAFYLIQSSVFQSAQFYSGAAGRNIPGLPLSYLRVAALALDTLANNKGKLGNVIQLLDVKLEWNKAAQILRDGAANYRQIDDDSGALMIIEQTNTDWSFRDRWWKQWQRQSAGAGLIGG